MLIDTRAIGFSLTDSIVRHVDARIEMALGPFSRWVFKTVVRLEDTNADRSGVDKRCVLIVTLRRHGVVMAEAVDADLYAAIDEAAHRIRRSVSRITKKHLASERHNVQRPGVLT